MSQVSLRRLVPVLSVLLVLMIAGCSKPTAGSAATQISPEELRAQTVTPTYDDLARNPEQYNWKPLRLTGEVVQVTGDAKRPALRVNVTKGEYDSWKDPVWVNVKTDVRVLQKDIVQVWGLGQGEKTYTAVLGNEIRVPQMDAYELSVVTKAGDRK